MWLSILLILILTIIFYLTGIKPIRYWDQYGVPTLKPWPYLGNLLFVSLRTRSLTYALDDIYTAFPTRRYVGYYHTTSPTLIIRDTELIKRIMVKEFETFPQRRTFAVEGVDSLWDNNLFGMKGGERWHKMRTTLSPAFTSNKMKIMFELLRECSKRLSDYYLQNGEMVSIELKDVFSRFSSNVIATAAFGVDCDSLRDRENEFFVMGKQITDLSGWKGLRFFLHLLVPTIAKALKIRIFSKNIDSFFERLVKGTIKFREENGVIRPDLIHLLMEARKETMNSKANTDQEKQEKKLLLTDEEIVAQAVGFFFAGFDTTSTMMCYAAYELALNPEIQEKLRVEVDEALGKCNGNITYDALMNMKYLNMVLTEALRKWPPFPLLDRTCVKPFLIEPETPEEKPLLVEPGVVCAFPVYSIQRDPRYFPNPDKFDPERFSEENKSNIDPISYILFGAGQRNCIGARFALMEGKLIIAEILSKFEIVPVEKTQIPIVFSPSLFNPIPDGGFWLGLKPRRS